MLVVFKGEDGQDYVATAMPTGVTDASQVRLFQASGPYMPLGWPKPEKVGDVVGWMEGLRQKGFTFQPAS